MTVAELIVELARVEDQSARVLFYYNDHDKTEVVFNVAGRVKPDAEEVKWVKETEPNSAIFVLC